MRQPIVKLASWAYNIEHKLYVNVQRYEYLD